MTTYSFRKSAFRTALIAASLVAGLSAGAYADSTAAPTPQPHSDSMGTPVTDAAITTQVKSKFVGDDG